MIGITERGDAALNYQSLNFDTVDGVILITKYPGMLEHFLSVFKPKIPFVVHCTITGMGHTLMEPNAQAIEFSGKSFKSMQDKYGKERVVLRVDPIIPTEKGLATAKRALSLYTAGTRLRISFLDAYPHVRNRFVQKLKRDLPWSGIHQTLEIRQDLLSRISNFVGSKDIEVCGEPDMLCTGCVSKRDLQAMGLNIEQDLLHRRAVNSRKTCTCVGLKQELLPFSSPCLHGCLYCYWRYPDEKN